MQSQSVQQKRKKGKREKGKKKKKREKYWLVCPASPSLSWGGGLAGGLSRLSEWVSTCRYMSSAREVASALGSSRTARGPKSYSDWYRGGAVIQIYFGQVMVNELRFLTYQFTQSTPEVSTAVTPYCGWLQSKLHYVEYSPLVFAGCAEQDRTGQESSNTVCSVRLTTVPESEER